MLSKAVFLDKDGTLIADGNYNADASKVSLAPGAIEGLRIMQQCGYRLVVVSNQPGVARGLFGARELEQVREAISEILQAAGLDLSGFYYCPHGPNDGCPCRKPGTGMLQSAAAELSLDLRQCWLIGDILDDVEAGRRAGCRSILINNGNETEWRIGEGDFRRPDLICGALDEAAGFIARGADGIGARLQARVNLKGWQEARHILCVRLDDLGDVLMTSPAIRALKRSRAERKITVLTSDSGAEAAALNSHVDSVIRYRAPWMKQGPHLPGSGQEEKAVETLRAGAFDAAVIFTVYSQSPLPAALFCYMAGIPLRLAHARENPYGLLTDWVPEIEPERTVRHEVQRQLDLAAHVGAASCDERLQARPPPAAFEKIERLLEQAGIAGGRPLVLMHTGAKAASRRYSADSFAEAARLLAQRTGCRLILTGTTDERPVLQRIRAAAGPACLEWGGLLNAAEFAALVARADLLISNNTSAVHLAAAAGTPVVDLYALTNPQHTPWRVPARVLFHDVPCRFCYKSVCPERHHACLQMVTPAAVVAAACELLGGAAETAAGDRGETEALRTPPSGGNVYADAGNYRCLP